MAQFKCTKSEFLAILAKKLKEDGVTVISADGKKSQSLETFWNLYKKIKMVEVATAAGSPVSLSGIGTHKFNVCGRNEKKCPRYKFKLSSAIQNIFISNQEIVDTKAPADFGAFEQRVNKVLEVLESATAPATPGDSAPEVI